MSRPAFWRRQGSFSTHVDRDIDITGFRSKIYKKAGWTEAGFRRDRDFVAEHKVAQGADEIYTNGDSILPGLRSLEGVFK